MIDTTTEAVISLAQAAAEQPSRRAGKATSVSCLYRWSTGGCRGIVLDTIQIGRYQMHKPRGIAAVL